MEGVVIIADPKGKGYAFAKRIYELMKSREHRNFDISLADLEITDFPDSEYKIKISDNIRRKICFFIHDPNKDARQWHSELHLALQAIRDSSPHEITTVFPYMRFSRQERKDESRVGVSAKAIADLLSFYGSSAMGVDFHASQIQQYSDTPFDHLYSFPVLIKHLEEHHPGLLKNLVVVSPDAGGATRAQALTNRLLKRGHSLGNPAFCYKRRDSDESIKEVKLMGEVEGKNCLIVDDIIGTGGTMIEAASVLKKSGAERIMIYGTHGFFIGGDMGKFDVFEKVIVSDTLYVEPRENFEILSLTELFEEAICRTALGESLSSLFR